MPIHLYPDLEKVMPAPATAPELLPTPRDPAGIRIGGTAGQIDVNFCLNPMCGNFGLTGPQAEARGCGYSLTRSYRVMHLKCPECQVLRRIYSNRAVDHMFLYLLKKTLAHEYCPREACENHRINFYEHFRAGKLANGDLYRKRGNAFEITCRKCPEEVTKKGEKYRPSFTVGTPWRRHSGRGRSPGDSAVKYLSDLSLFMNLINNNCGPSNVIDITNCRPQTYYDLLSAFGETCNSISGSLMMRLQDRQRFGNDKEIRLYSDIMQITLKKGGKQVRHHHLNYLVTITDYEDSYVALAATLMFYPAAGKTSSALRKEMVKLEEGDKMECHRDHAHLLWEGVPRRSDQHPKIAGFSVLSKEGYFVQSGYAALGHFLTLRKMLSGFGRITHYVDNEDPLRMAALTAFADRVLEDRCDVVYISNQKNISEEQISKRRDQAYDETDDPLSRREEHLKEIAGSMGSKLQKAAEAYLESEQQLCENRDRGKKIAIARVYGKALHKAKPGKTTPENGKKTGRNLWDDFQLWVQDPFPPRSEPGRYFCRATRRPGKIDTEQTKHEADLYLRGKLQPVDTYFSALRANSSTCQRPPHRASQGHSLGFGSQAGTVRAVFFELSLIRFRWNFMRRKRTSGKKNEGIARAHVLGILDEKTLTIEQAPMHRESVLERAREITECLGT